MILNTSTWKEFKLSDSDLFDLYSSKNSLDKIKIIDLENEPKIFNYISRSEVNNGVCFKICKQNVKINKGHCLTIGLDTQTSFYQEQDFYTGQNIQILRIKKNCSKYTYIFLSSIIKLIIKNKFQWGGNGATLSRLKKISIKLPVDADGNPDWEYMANYVKYLIEKDNLNISELSKALSNVHYELNASTWKEFIVKQIFKISKTKDSSKIKKEGKIPYVSRKGINNGVVSFKEVSNELLESNCLTIHSEWSNTFICFYQENNFCADGKIVKLVNNKLNKYNGIFISTIFSKISTTNYKLNTILNTKIKLPVDADGNPDWEYMANYVKSLPYSKYL